MNMRSIYLLISLLVVSLGCKSETMHMDSTTHFTYLALGDSYTIGEGVEENKRYPLQLQDSLRKNDIHLDTVQIIARTGWTTDELNTAIDNASLKDAYDMVTLLIGVNNQYRGRSTENYLEEFAALLQRAIAFAGNNPSKVIVISIPDWGVTPFAEGRDREQIALEIDAFNAINREQAQKAGVAWVNVTPVSREAAQRVELLAQDGLHPSGLMYSYWVELLIPYALQILQ